MAEGIRTARRSDLILLWFMSVLLGCRPSGPGAGFRAFRRNHAGGLGLPRVAGTDPDRGDGREIEPLLAARSRDAGLRVAEVPVTYYPQLGRGAFLAGFVTLIHERLARRHAPKAPATESIVVLTGGPSPRTPGGPPRPALTELSRRLSDGETGPSRRASDRPSREIDPSRRTSERPSREIDPSRRAPREIDPFRPAAGAASRPTLGPYFAGPVNTPRKPGADHRPTDPGLRRWPAPNRAAAAAMDHPNSAGIGLAERRGGGERRAPERRRTDATPDRRATAGRPGHGRPNGDSPNRRRWRDGQTDLNLGRRPDLRVINGEGSGSGGTRGHLRSV